MDTQTVLVILIFANTIALLFVLMMVAVMLVKINTEIHKFIDIKTSLAELQKVIEQQSRVLEYISHKNAL